MSHRLNLRAWLRRVRPMAAFDTVDVPDFVPAIQPTQVISDASALTPAIFGPTASFGFNLGAPPAGQFAAAALSSLAEGGTAVRVNIVSGIGFGWFTRAIVTPPLATAITAEIELNDPVALAYAGAFGTTQLTTTSPTLGANAVIDFTMFLPSGQQLVIQSPTANVPIQGWFDVEEYPAEDAA